ncbi:bifunctional tRNA (adenosine(37)-N6)-threonylcarbamoyltransferase complex ATPase subunit type 1 TsaE/phosphotransferase [Polynucleobacter sp. TUM22923]|jgi:tRNA threonylcarbamoyladenosine biosynthesis protein TsaE|nr:bifunctional tRNA (adenosine(37)-N6)-threonylcarbamoyltransferase complex ATPase subunit type 1 TsaE/phosphotransferase [Polynucleobacter sp. TUM22923]
MGVIGLEDIKITESGLIIEYTKEMAQDTFTQHCRQEAETAALSGQLALSLGRFFQLEPHSHLNIALEGDLGAGKTTFARYLIQGLGYVDRVKSPTYTLCEPYPFICHASSLIANHFDLYRMRDPLEWQEAGFAEQFDEPGFCLVEWPEKAEGTLPAFDIQIQLVADGEEHERTIKIQAQSPSGVSVLNMLHSLRQQN